MEEVDEFGIPIKRAEVEVDEFGIPIKKKVQSEPSSTASPASESEAPSTSQTEEVPLMLQGKTPEDKYVPNFTQDVDRIKKEAEESNQALLREEKQLYDNIQALKVITPQDNEQRAQIEAEGRKMQEQYLAIQDKKEELLREREQIPVGTNAGAIRNSLAEGFTAYSEDVSRFTLDLMAKAFPAGVSPELRDKSPEQIREAINATIEDAGIKKTLDDKLKTASTNEAYVEKLKKESMLWAGGLGLAESAYLMTSPKMSGFFVSGYVAGSDIINEKYPDMPEAGKMAYQTAYGAISILSEEAGITNLVANNPVTKRLVNKILTKAAQEAIGKITSKGIGKAAKEVLEGFISEGESGLGEYVGQEIEGQVVDLLMDENKFENKSLSQLAEEGFTAFALEGIGGVIMKSPSVGGGLAGDLIRTRNNSIVNDVLTDSGINAETVSVESFDKLSKVASSPTRQEAIKEALQIAVNKDEMSQGKAEEIMQRVNSLVETKKSLPDNLSKEKQLEAFNLIEERKAIQSSIEGKDKALVTAETEKIKAIDRNLAVIGGAPREEGEVLYNDKKKTEPKTELNNLGQESIFNAVDDLGDNESKTFTFETLEAIPESLKEKAVSRGEIEVEIDGKKEKVQRKGFEVTVTGKELRDIKDQFEQQKPQEDANEITSPESVPMGEQPQSSEGVREQNTQEQEATKEEGQKPQEEKELIDISDEEIAMLENELSLHEEEGDLLGNIGEKAYMGNEEGMIEIDPENQNTIVFNTNDRIYVLGNIDEVGSELIASKGLSLFPKGKIKAEEKKGKDISVITFNGKEYVFLGRARDKKGQAVVKLKEVNTGLERRMKGESAEMILKDVSLQKDARQQQIPLKTEGKEVDFAAEAKRKKEQKKKERLERKKAKEEFEQKTIKQLEEEKSKLDKETSALEEELISQAAKESSKEKRMGVKVGDKAFMVTEKSDGTYSVSQANGSGKYVAIKDESVREKAIKEYKSIRKSNDAKRIADAESLISDFKKEQEDKFLSLLDKAIAATDYRRNAFEGTLGLPVFVVNSALKTVRAAYKAGKSLSESIEEAYDFISNSGYKVPEYNFKKYILSVIKEPNKQQEILGQKESPSVQAKTEGANEGAKPKESVKDKFKKSVELFYKTLGTRGGEQARTAKKEREAFLKENPKIDFIDKQMQKIYKQLEAKGLLEREGNCP